MVNIINVDAINTPLFWLKSSNIIQQGQAKEFESQKIEVIRQNIESWIQNPSDIFDFNSYLSDSTKIDSLKQNSRINDNVVWESSKRYSNVSEEQYNEAKDYLFKQMDEILLSTYIEEGDSKLFSTLLIQATTRNSFATIKEATDNIESSATNFSYALSSGNKKDILKATAELEEDLGILSSADFLAMPNLTQFFTFAESKISQENMQTIINSLGIMRKFIDENLSIHKTGSITLRSGTMICRFSNDNGESTLEVSLSNTKIDNLFLYHTQQNFNTLLQMLESKEQTIQDSKQISNMLLTQLLRKEKVKK